uniref:Outer dense fiber protein 2 n=1 Tax=Neolamprologus brichardi TaxID=32507 RepID=A0A3Q4GFE0_NEOBR
TRTRSNSPPIHVHINDTVPVHVHLESQRTRCILKGKTAVNKADLRPTAKVKTRGLGITPGKTSIRDATYKWEGPTHNLEITPPQPEPESSQSALQLADLASEEEEGLHGQISQYTRKIDNLLTEVSSLKNEVKRQSKQLSVSQRVIAEQEEELAEVTKELEETEKENTRLRLSMEKMLEENDCNRQMRLSQCFVDAVFLSLSVSLLLKKPFGSESSALACQNELLLQKLETFEVTNRTLRKLLREQHESQVLNNMFSFLLQHLVVKLQEKDREVNRLGKLLDNEKVADNARSTAVFSKSLESTRAHLQGQLRSKDAENSRLTVQIKNLEKAANQQKVEIKHLTDQLVTLKQQAGADREALKRAARAQKQRAERSEDTAGHLSIQLLDMVRPSTAQTYQSVKTFNQLHTTKDKGRAEKEALLDRLREITAESTAAKLENQSLKATASAVEEKLSVSQLELQQVKVSIRQYEGLLDSYKMQLEKTQAEADEYCARLAQAEQKAQTVQGELEKEIDEVRRELLGRLAELEPLPEALQRSQLQLQEAQDRECSQEKHSLELSTALTDLRMKVETQGSQMELLRQKKKVLLEENTQLQQRVESLERSEAGSQNSDLLAVIAKREETVHSNELRLKEKTRECSLLSHRLEEALDDARQQMSETKERVVNKQRSTQSKILDLENQLSRTTAEINQLRRSKEQVKWRYQSQLQDLKDRLEQSDSTNRSLQNYVQFLKGSYASVFGDFSHSSSLQASSPS